MNDLKPESQARPGFFSLRLRLDWLIFCAGWLTVLATLAGLAGRWHWKLDQFAHFRVQYALVLLGVAVALLVLRRFRWGVSFAGFAVLNAVFFVPLYVGGAGEPSDGPVLRLLLLNVNACTGRAPAVRALLERYQPDVFVVQELTPRMQEGLEPVHVSLPHRFLLPRSDCFGIGVYSRWPLQQPRRLNLTGLELPTVAVTVRWRETPLALVSTHPPPPVNRGLTAWRDEQLFALAGTVGNDKPQLLAGDLNTTPWHYMFRRLQRETGLHNAARGYGVQPTWPAGRPPLWVPLDHVLHSAHWRVTHYEVGPAVGSDHYPVVVDFVLREAAPVQR